MTTSPDHPQLQFVQAAGYTKGRPDGPPLWIVWHDMEASEHSLRAESTAAYFANPTDGRSVSSTYCVDDNSVVQCVRLADSAWTVGNRPGNNRGINWELSGFARQTRAEWLDPFGIAMFARAAPIVAADMLRYNIPNRWCTVDDLLARRPGHTTHNDLRVAFGGTTHTDPGAGFPRDYVLEVVGKALNPQEADMPKTFIISEIVQGPQGPISANALYASGGSGFHHIKDAAFYGQTWGFDPFANTGKPMPLAEAYRRFGPFLGEPEELATEPGPPGPATLVPHTHEVGTTGPADATP